MTLQDFFGQKKIEDSNLEKLGGKDAIGDLKSQLAEQYKTVEWSAIWNSIIGHVDQLLDIRLFDIMVRPWKNYRDLAKYLDAEKYPPDRSYLAPLLEHTIVSKHKPEIVVELPPFFKKAIPFDISVELFLKGFTLEIQSGKIKKIYTGQCRGGGSVQCMNVTLLRKVSEDIALPGIINLGEGIPIGKAEKSP